LGNPNLNPEVNVSYEIGYKSQINKDLGISVTAYNNNRFDYIVSRRVIVNDATGRPVSKTMYINQDYAKILGLEFGIQQRVRRYMRLFGNVTYQVARGKSNSARESSLQIEQNGEVPVSTEQYLAWDRPWNVNLGVVLNYDSASGFFPKWTKGMQLYLSSSYQSGIRYTPQELEGYNNLGRPLYRSQNEAYLQERATPWFNTDLKINKSWNYGKEKGITLSLEARNLLNNKNAQIINPVTGRAYEPGDDVPNTWRDPRYIGPEESGAPSDNPARYLPPRQCLFGVKFRF
jgi:outer membrane receptor protein involved in Fe transport